MEKSEVKPKPVEDEHDGREVFSTMANEGRKSLLANLATTTPNKIYPVDSDLDPLGIESSRLESKYTEAEIKAKPNGAPKEVGHSVLLSVVVSLAACTCLVWTLWLILLNVAPNETVNQIMDTETFDYGSFWLMIKPSSALVGLTTSGLSVVALGYFAVLIKMVVSCRRHSKQACVVSHSGKRAHSAAKCEMVFDDAAESAKIVSDAMHFAASLASEESLARKFVKLGLKFGDLALETLLLYQMLEAGSPAPLIGIFTAIVACNALSCVGTMFVPYEKAPLAEPLIDIMFDFLISVGCPMLVVFYCLSTFTFDRAKFAINLAVFPAGWFEQGASVIADPVETAVIYKNLKSLRIMSALDLSQEWVSI